MDFITLGMEIKREPAAYETDYRENLEIFRSMSRLPIKPYKNFIKLTDFLARTCRYYESEFPELLIESFYGERDRKIKMEIFKHIFHLKITNRINSADFFKIFFHCRKRVPFRRLESEIAKIRDLDEQKKLIEIFSDFYATGDEFQQKIANYLLIFAYENSFCGNIKLMLTSSLFSMNFSVAKTTIFYFLNFLDFEIKNSSRTDYANMHNETRQKEFNFLSSPMEYGENVPKIFDDLNHIEAKNLCKKLINCIRNFKGERIHRIYLLKVFSKLKIEFDISLPIYEHLNLLIDIRKDDNKIFMIAFIQSVSGEESLMLLKKIINVFCQDYRDDDILAYGIELLGHMASMYIEHKEFIRDTLKDYRKIKRKEIQRAYCNAMRLVKDA